MSHQWHIDLGFDTNASNPSNQLQWAVVTSGGSPGFFSDFKINDQMVVFIFNITQPQPAEDEGPSISNVTIGSTTALTGQSSTTPFGGNANPFSGAVIDSLGYSAFSSAYGAGLQGWQLNSGGGSLLVAAINSSGQFAFTFSVTASTVTTPFSVDPTMIVTSGT